MSNFETLKKELAFAFNIDKFEFAQSFGDDSIVVPNESIIPVLRFLKEQGHFDFFCDLCGVDYPNRAQRFDVVYHLLNTKTGRRVRLKPGTLLTIEKGERHEVRNTGATPLRTLNFYSPPAFDADGDPVGPGRG